MLTADSQNLFPVLRLEGKNVNVVALNLDLHLKGLWEAQTKFKETFGTDVDLMFAYRRAGPFSTVEDFKKYVMTLQSYDDLYAYVIEYKSEYSGPPTIVGFAAYTDIVPEHRKCEIGHVWLDPRYRRRNIMDEAVYLMVKYAFEECKYQRVTWTCNSRNESSRKMALRNEFKLEGVLRNYYFSKGVKRNEIWLSIIDTEWEEAKKNLENRIYTV